MHCACALDSSNAAREHIPSKCLLREPYPDELMTLESCRACNASYSRDEEYLTALLTAVLAGSTDPDKQKTAKDSRMFETRSGLRLKIEKAKMVTSALFGETEVTFTPECERVHRVVVKNARGHALYELDKQMSDKPCHVFAEPFQRLMREQRLGFEGVEGGFAGWEEIGTRMFQRQCDSFDPTQSDMSGSWVIVQDGVYRHAAVDTGEALLVRSVIQEYLATEVYWNYGDSSQ